MTEAPPYRPADVWRAVRVLPQRYWPRVARFLLSEYDPNAEPGTPAFFLMLGPHPDTGLSGCRLTWASWLGLDPCPKD